MKIIEVKRPYTDAFKAEVRRLYDINICGDFDGFYKQLVYFAALEGDTLAGYSCCKPSTILPKMVNLACTVVKDEYRGRGLQRQFLKAREEWAASNGFSGVWTYTGCEVTASMNNLIKEGYRTFDNSDIRDWLDSKGWVLWRKDF